MRFCKPKIGNLVEPVPGFDSEAVLMRCNLPNKIKEHPAFEAWLAGVAEAAELENDMAREEPAATIGVQSEWLTGLADATHRMRNALALLKIGADRESLADLLQPHGDYLLWRASQYSGNQEGRPKVPHLPSDAKNFAVLLERTASDLEALELICNHMQSKLIELPSSLPKHRERRLIRTCAELFRSSFGHLPPQRGWFGDEFMPYAGECVGLTIGHRIVGEVVTELARDPAAP